MNNDSVFLTFYVKVDIASVQAGTDVYQKVQIPVDYFNAAIDHYGFVKERTCKLKWTPQGETQTQEFWRCECGACGHEFGVRTGCAAARNWRRKGSVPPNYCPNCGARVVGDAE